MRPDDITGRSVRSPRPALSGSRWRTRRSLGEPAQRVQGGHGGLLTCSSPLLAPPGGWTEWARTASSRRRLAASLCAAGRAPPPAPAAHVELASVRPNCRDRRTMSRSAGDAQIAQHEVHLVVGELGQRRRVLGHLAEQGRKPWNRPDARRPSPPRSRPARTGERTCSAGVGESRSAAIRERDPRMMESLSTAINTGATPSHADNAGKLNRG